MKHKFMNRIDWNFVILLILSAGVLAGCEYCQPLVLISVGYRCARKLLGDSDLAEYLLR